MMMCWSWGTLLAFAAQIVSSCTQVTAAIAEKNLDIEFSPLRNEGVDPMFLSLERVYLSRALGPSVPDFYTTRNYFEVLRFEMPRQEIGGPLVHLEPRMPAQKPVDLVRQHFLFERHMRDAKSLHEIHHLMELDIAIVIALHQ